MGGISGGGGKSSGNQSTQAQLTPEQVQTINLQNQFLQSYLPTLSGVTQGAGQAYQGQAGQVNQASQNAINTANTAGNIQGNIGANALQQGTQGLSNLFSPQYEQEQVQGALAPAQFAAQQANVGSNAGFAGAGEAGSARNALANQATQALNQQMLGSTAAQVESGITAGRASAGTALGQLGTQNLASAPGTIGSTLGYASAPLTNYGQYASLLFGAPSQTPNYAGTQSQAQSGSSKGGGLSFSDIRLKTIINNLNYGLNEILKIKPISWFWKNKEILGDKKEIGFSAQEMQKIIPEIVYTENEILKIDYSKLTAVLTIAVQQQQLQIDQINQKIKEREFA